MSSDNEEKPISLLETKCYYVNEYDAISESPPKRKRFLNNDRISDDEEFVQVSINKRKVLQKLKQLQNEVKNLKTELQECKLENDALRENNVKLLVENFKLKNNINKSTQKPEDPPRIQIVSSPIVRKTIATRKKSRRVSTPEPEEEDEVEFAESAEEDNLQSDNSFSKMENDTDDIDWTMENSQLEPKSKRSKRKADDSNNTSHPDPDESINVQYYERWEKAKDMQERIKEMSVDCGRSLRDLINVSPGIKKDCLFVNKLASLLFKPDVLANSSITGNTTNNMNFSRRANQRLDPERISFLREVMSFRLDCEGTNIEQKLERMRKINKHMTVKIQAVRSRYLSKN